LPPPQPAPTSAPVSSELYIRRLRVDEGLYRLDAYLDAAFLAGHLFVRVIHGKGAGVLKGAVWQRLKEHPLVHSYRLADPGDGDAGVTVVELVTR
ncbi:MAG: Smr/MutS family protein, partial [Chloroflexi bacterium]|nr:Smr/MutS family protein [Chloroflexota bacterium]